MKPMKLFFPVLTLATLGLGATPVSMAQEEEQLLEEIIVTATRKETQLMTTSIAVSAKTDNNEVVISSGCRRFSSNQIMWATK